MKGGWTRVHIFLIWWGDKMHICTRMLSDDEYPMVAVHASWLDHVYICGFKVTSNQNSNVASSNPYYSYDFVFKLHSFKSHGWITFKGPLAVRNIHLASRRGRFRGQCGWRAFRGAGLLASRVSLTCWVQYDTPSPMTFYKWTKKPSISMAPWHCFTNASQMATMLVNCKSTTFCFAAPNEDVLYNFIYIYKYEPKKSFTCAFSGLHISRYMFHDVDMSIVWRRWWDLGIISTIWPCRHSLSVNIRLCYNLLPSQKWIKHLKHIVFATLATPHLFLHP